MPANFDTGWTFEQIILRTAERYGCADQTGSIARIPSDTYILDKVKRAVNDGYKEFIRSNPNWSFRVRDFTIITDPAGTGPDNVRGDAGVYRLPRWIQRPPRQDFQYLDHSFPLGPVRPVTRQEIMRRLQLSPMAAPPQLCLVWPVDAADGLAGTGTAYKVIFWPKPNAVYTLESTAYVFPYDMLELAEKHVAGAEHDEAVLAFALKHMYKGLGQQDAQKKAEADEDAATQLAMSLKIDGDARVGVKGVLKDPTTRVTTNGGYFPGDSSANFTYEGQQILT